MGGGGLRLDKNQELKLLLKIAKKRLMGVRSRGGLGVRIDSNIELKLL